MLIKEELIYMMAEVFGIVFEGEILEGNTIKYQMTPDKIMGNIKSIVEIVDIDMRIAHSEGVKEGLEKASKLMKESFDGGTSTKEN